jgi:hypothetical protein
MDIGLRISLGEMDISTQINKITTKVKQELTNVNLRKIKLVRDECIHANLN